MPVPGGILIIPAYQQHSPGNSVPALGLLRETVPPMDATT